MAAANVSRFLLLGGRPSLQKSAILTTARGRLENHASSFTTAALSYPSNPNIQPSYKPCLLLDTKNEVNSLDETGGAISYTFYSLEESKVIEKKKMYSPAYKDYLWPKQASLVGSSRGWLAYFDLSRKFEKDFDSTNENIYLTNPSFPFLYNQIFKLGRQCWDIDRIALSSAPRMNLNTSNARRILKSFEMIFLDDDHRFDDDSRSYNRMAYFSPHQKFYGIDIFDQGLDVLDFAMDYASPPTIPASLPAGEAAEKLRKKGTVIYTHEYLVECAGNLLAVRRHCSDHVSEDGNVLRPDEDPFDELFYATVGVDIYKMNFEGKKWVPVKCLGDYALFLGDNDSFSLSTQEFPYLKSNSIYFGECVGNRVKVKEAPEIFSLDDNSFEMLNVSGNNKMHWLMVDVDLVGSRYDEVRKN